MKPLSFDDLSRWDRTNHFLDWWEFDLVAKEWRSFTVDFPAPVGQHTAEIDVNTVLFFGGYHATSQTASDLLWSYSLGHLGRLNLEA